MELWEIEAREQIRELIAAYTHLGDGGRISEMTDLFTEDAVLDAGGSLHEGHGAISAFYGAIADGSSPGPKRSFIRHYISNVSIELTSSTTATGKSYWSVISDEGLESSGRYWDTYVNVGTSASEGTSPWRFATRKIRHDKSKL
ncbi:MAG: nuclear transport factor 2 family protein [Actinomycetota bacterium]|nr:nuclear transport factor 2 family protein [Actinomycetota bacterium]